MSEENKVTISFENGDEHEVEVEPTEVVVTIGVPKRHIEAKLEMEKKLPHRIGKWEEEIDERLRSMLAKVEGVYLEEELLDELFFVVGDMNAKEVAVALDEFKTTLDRKPMLDYVFFDFINRKRIPGMGLPHNRVDVEVTLDVQTAKRLTDAAARLAMNEQTLSAQLISTMEDEVACYERHLREVEESRKAFAELPLYAGMIPMWSFEPAPSKWDVPDDDSDFDDDSDERDE